MLLIAQSFSFSNIHAFRYRIRCSEKALRGFQQLSNFNHDNMFIVQ